MLLPTKQLLIILGLLYLTSNLSYAEDVVDLDLEALLDINITSVSKRNQRLSDSAAAIFVITKDDITTSGATSIPELLRSVPGLNVARIDSSKWAITARGFNGRLANKLLVLMDGRSVYTPTFSGVYWEVQDTLLEDIERIEIIRGPGATLWGANAVNGVINIITKHAADTQGNLGTIRYGTNHNGAGSFRHGRKITPKSYARTYIKYLQRGEFENLATHQAAHDDLRMLRSGFRIDSHLSLNQSVTLQADIYQGDINQNITLFTRQPPSLLNTNDQIEVAGGNLTGRWHYTPTTNSEIILQAYYDHTDRNEFYEHEVRDTFDIEFQHTLIIKQHDIIYGAGYRYTRDQFKPLNNDTIIFSPEKRDDSLFNVFLQDKITLLEQKLWLTLGIKFEHNDYTGFEIQPNIRLLWQPHQYHKIWAAVSKATRTPSRAEHTINFLLAIIPPNSELNPTPLPTLVDLQGNSNFQSEELLAYELGYRVQPTPQISLDLALFYNEYDDIRDSPPAPPSLQANAIIQPLVFNSTMKVCSQGLELTGTWQATNAWQSQLTYSMIAFKLHTEAQGIAGQFITDTVPRQQISWRNHWHLAKTDISLSLRYTDSITNADITGKATKIPAYTTLDAHVSWPINKQLTFVITGQDLLDNAHLEYVEETFTQPTEISRSIYGQLQWQF